MKLLAGVLAGAGLVAIASPAAAQISLEANVARADGDWGGELGAGYSVVSMGGFRITPGIGLFIHDGDDDRYYLDRSGSEPLCRSSMTGQRAADGRCDSNSTKIYGRLEATYTLPAADVMVGMGGRLMSGNLRPYGTVAAPLLPMLSLKGNVGYKYYAAGLQARF